MIDATLDIVAELSRSALVVATADASCCAVKLPGADVSGKASAAQYALLLRIEPRNSLAKTVTASSGAIPNTRRGLPLGLNSVARLMQDTHLNLDGRSVSTREKVGHTTLTNERDGLAGRGVLDEVGAGAA